MTTWNYACSKVVSEIDNERTQPRGAAMSLDERRAADRQQLQDLWGIIPEHVRLHIEPQRHYFKVVAAVAWRLSAQLVIDRIVKTLVSKQQDYGHENIASLGTTGILVRLNDKLARYFNLIEKGTAAANEPLDDTLLDLVGYGAIGMMWLDGTFMLPLADKPLSSQTPTFGGLVVNTTTGVVERPWVVPGRGIVGYEQQLPTEG